jgi:hypothetical protein
MMSAELHVSSDDFVVVGLLRLELKKSALW